MVAFREMRQWDEPELQRHVDDRIEESLQLDYKSAEALDKTDKRKEDISKDISAMANADGGTIIYGVSEKGHLPTRISWVDRTKISREWLEEVVRSGISPPIQGLVIHGVTAAADSRRGAYVVEIPRSHTAHQARDFRYYKRLNFQSIPMSDDEVRRVMNRGIARIIERKLSGGLGLMYGFFVMVAHAGNIGDTAVEVIGPRRGTTTPANLAKTVADQFADVVRERGIFSPSGGTLHDLPRDKGIIQLWVEDGAAQKARDLPASYILLEGIKHAMAACGTTLATYGPSMGLDLVVKVDRFYEHLYSAHQVVSGICANKEILQASEGRITDEVFLDHIRLLVRYLAEFHRHEPGRLEDADPNDLRGALDVPGDLP